MGSLRFILRQRNWFVVLTVGSALVIVGCVLMATRQPLVATILVGIGTSLLAAWIVTYLSPASAEVYQRFLRLGVVDFFESRKDIPNPQWVQWLAGLRYVTIQAASKEVPIPTRIVATRG